MKKKEIITFIALASILGGNIQQIENIYDIKSYNATLLSNNANNNSIYSTISLNGYWGGNPYLVSSISFNNSTKRLILNNKGKDYFSWSSKNKAYTITLLSQNGKVIKSKNYYGANTSEDVYKDFNGIKLSYGDYIKMESYGLDMSMKSIDGKVKNIEGNDNPSLAYKITNKGFKKVQNKITLSHAYFNLNSNEVSIEGKSVPNSLVSIWVNDTEYTTKSNKVGEYNLVIKTKSNVSPNTVIRAFCSGSESEKAVELNPDKYKLNYTSISLNGYWGGSPYLVSKINFNQFTKKLDIENKGKIYFSWSTNSPAYIITLLNKNGKKIKSIKYTGSGCSQDVYDDFNGVNFKYGDYIEIKSFGLDMSLNNPNNEIDNIPGKGIKKVEYEITQDGLKEIKARVVINPVYYNIGSTKITVSGTANPDSQVNIWIDNKDHITKTNINGEYKLNIDASKDITSKTKIKVFVEGEEEQTVIPSVNPNIYKIIKNNIILVGNWQGGLYKAANISFNPETMSLNITGSMNDYFASGVGKAFKIYLFSKNGYLIKSKIYDTNNQTKNLYNDFNDLKFNYGDIIKISSLGLGQVKISNYEGQSNYIVNKSIQMKITQNGLKPSNLNQIKVNPFGVLGNGKVTSGILTGASMIPNKEVKVIVNGRVFSTESNSKGSFKVNIEDSKGFLSTTNIVVETLGELATEIKPTANKNLGILKSNILIHGEDGVIAQEVSFNPATMTVVKSAPWGNNFVAQLINGTTGRVISSCGTEDFKAFNSKDNLNGSHFQYGDIISVYETK